MKRLTLVIFLLSLLFAASFIHTVKGDDDDSSDPVERDEEDRYGLTSDTSRQVEIELQDFLLEIQAQNEQRQDGAETSDQITFSVELINSGDEDTEGKLLDSEFEYERETEDTESEVELRLRILRIIEFLESGANPGFQDGEDTIVSSYSDKTWNPFTSVESDDTEGVREFSAETSDGVFGIRVYVTESGLTEAFTGSQNITANDYKFDAIISGYNFANPGESRLAIEAIVRQEVENEYEDDDIDDDDDENEAEVRFVRSETGYAARFAWVTTAQVGNNDVNVIATSPSSDSTSSQTMYFTFDTTEAFNELVWDPTIGLEGRTADGSAAATSKSVIAGFIAVLMTTLIALL
jgi:hypothetical protein